MLEGQAIIAQLDAARFRGEFLQCWAQIEDHLCLALERLADLGEVNKRPYLSGQKFDQVRKNAQTPGVWMHREHVESVLGQLAPFVELRGSIGHAVMAPATIDGEAAISWRPPGLGAWTDRQTMTETEMRATLAELRALAAKFLRQPLVPKA